MAGLGNAELGARRRPLAEASMCEEARVQSMSPPSLSASKRRRRETPGAFNSLNSLLARNSLVMTLLLVLSFVAFYSIARSFAYFTRREPTRMAPAKHAHAIPNVLIFTHRINLLTSNVTVSKTGAHTDTKQTRELLALQQNILHTIDLHPSASVRFLTDDDCLRSIRAMRMSDGDSRRLVDYFQKETTGMYKADLCRGAALWETGGLYFDADLGVRLNLWSVINSTTTFCTVRVHQQSLHKGAFFQAFIAATPRHPVLQRYVQLFLDYYDGRLDEISGPLGVLLLKRAYDEIVEEQEALEDGIAGGVASAADDNLASRSDVGMWTKQTSEIWQEILYRPDYQVNIFKDIPPPTWGTRRACKFVVVAGMRLPITVPFYSRIAGSRICPISANDTGVQKSISGQAG